MSNNQRVLNLTRGYSLKHKQACRAVEQCSAAWVDYGVSVRDLTLAESIAKRNEQAMEREPLPVAELAHLRYTPPESGKEATRKGYDLIRQADAMISAPKVWIN